MIYLDYSSLHHPSSYHMKWVNTFFKSLYHKIKWRLAQQASPWRLLVILSVTNWDEWQRRILGWTFPGSLHCTFHSPSLSPQQRQNIVVRLVLWRVSNIRAEGGGSADVIYRPWLITCPSKSLERVVQKRVLDAILSNVNRFVDVRDETQGLLEAA